MKSFSHPNPEAAAPGEIVGIYPFTLSPEESELIGNHLFAANHDFPVCHYIKAERFQELLESAALSLRRLDLYEDDDPLEGLYPEANRQSISPADAQLRQQANIAERDYDAFLRSQAIHRTHCYVHCWFGIPREDADMWERFGDEGHGACIVSSTHRLAGAIARKPTIFYELGKVTYWPEDKPMPDLHSSTVMFRKRPKFAAENEVRLLAGIKMEHLPLSPEGFLLPCPERLAVGVDLSSLVAGVIQGPRMTAKNMWTLAENTRAKIPGAKILRSRFDVRP
jgi:hypothetical protein